MSNRQTVLPATVTHDERHLARIEQAAPSIMDRMLRDVLLANPKDAGAFAFLTMTREPGQAPAPFGDEEDPERWDGQS